MTVVPYQPADVVAATAYANGQEVQHRQLRGLSLLVHSEQKIGKSSLADSGFRPVLCMDAENAATYTPSRKIYWDPVRQTVPQPPGDHLTAGYGQPSVTPAWETCVVAVTGYPVIDASLKILATGRHPFNSVSVDSVPTIQDRIMRSMAGQNAKMTQDQWGILLRNVTGMVWGFKDLLTNPVKQVWSVTFVCPTHYDRHTGKFRPWLLGQSSGYVPYVPEVEGYLYTGPNDTRLMWIGPHDTYETGNRLWGRLPDEMLLGYPGFKDGWTVETMTRRVLETQ